MPNDNEFSPDYVPPGYDPKNDAIDLVPYNNEWPHLAQLEIEKLYTWLPKAHLIDIQHVGSTAIPDMLAKPIIDIQIAVDSLEAFKPFAIDILEKHEYSFWHGNPDPERMFFVKGMPPLGERRTHHVHIVEPNSKHWTGKIDFRDYLRTHPIAQQEYAALKIRLAKLHMHDREKYTNEKSEFVQNILKKCSRNI